MNGNRLTDYQKRLIPLLREQGLSIVQIAKEAGTTPTTAWYRVNPEAYKKEMARLKERRRTHVGTVINGKFTYLPAPNKRSKPANCELCNENNSNLGYHHWDNSDPSLGIWVCYRCHLLVGTWECGGREKIAKYLVLKEKLTGAKVETKPE
jgi:hypothetical protein